MLYSKHSKSRAATIALWSFLCLISFDITLAQENAQLNIPSSLVECYNTSYFMNRENRLPSNIETLITLIEKVENTPGFNQDIRQVAVSLLHRFRQDGIQRAPNVPEQPGIIPYSPTGFQFPKFRLLLKRLIPGNAFQFPNSSLTREERCSLHFMLSSSFDTRVRNDENQVCNQLSQYRAQRIRRGLTEKPNKFQGNNFMGDVELFETMKSSRGGHGALLNGQQMRPNPNSQSFDTQYGWSDNDYGYSYGNSNNNVGNNNAISQCPVENGVVRTQWGTVAAGTLIAGIAAGLQQQYVQLRTLLALARRPMNGGAMQQQQATVQIDNRWAATLAGDLAEVALVQVPTSQSNTATVGANGAWNSTVMPKWYFLSQRQNLEMTDAEIRGGLDGLILAMNVANWRTQAPNLKLSQLLRMYYSMNGVLGSGIMACNRKDNFGNVAPVNMMIAQTTGFAQVLDREMQLHVTLSPDIISQFSTYAANALNSYVPQNLNDVSCSVSSSLPQDISASVTPMTNIYVFLDTSWQYKNVVDYVTYVLQRLNINPYASSVTMLAAADGTVMVNTTNLLSDVYEQWNITTHSNFVGGFNLPTVLRTIQNLTQSLLNEERTNNSLSGRSLVALMIPNMASVTEGDSVYSNNQLRIIYEQVPDLHFIYFTGGTINRFASFVRKPNEDIFALNSGSTVSSTSGPVAMRIAKIPRRIINPRCGSNWYATSWGNDQMAQYVRPGVINFYRVVPNYFYGAGGGRYVNVQSQNSMQFTVCSSRSVILPMANNNTNGGSTTGTNNDNNQACVQINGGNSFAYDLSNACNGYSFISQCPPLYISVQAAATTGNGQTQTVSCSDAACQTPDQVRYTVSVVNLGCYSGVAHIVASLTTVTLALLLHQVLQYLLN